AAPRPARREGLRRSARTSREAKGPRAQPEGDPARARRGPRLDRETPRGLQRRRYRLSLPEDGRADVPRVGERGRQSAARREGFRKGAREAPAVREPPRPRALQEIQDELMKIAGFVLLMAVMAFVIVILVLNIRDRDAFDGGSLTPPSDLGP